MAKVPKSRANALHWPAASLDGSESVSHAVAPLFVWLESILKSVQNVRDLLVIAIGMRLDVEVNQTSVLQRWLRECPAVSKNAVNVA